MAQPAHVEQARVKRLRAIAAQAETERDMLALQAALTAARARSESGAPWLARAVSGHSRHPIQVLFANTSHRSVTFVVPSERMVSKGKTSRRHTVAAAAFFLQHRPDYDPITAAAPALPLPSPPTLTLVPVSPAPAPEAEPPASTTMAVALTAALDPALKSERNELRRTVRRLEQRLDRVLVDVQEAERERDAWRALAEDREQDVLEIRRALAVLSDAVRRAR